MSFKNISFFFFLVLVAILFCGAEPFVLFWKKVLSGRFL